MCNGSHTHTIEHTDYKIVEPAQIGKTINQA